MAWSKTASEAGPAVEGCPSARAQEHERESMPSDSSMACISDALSLQSPKRRLRMVSTGYGLKEWMPNSSAT